MTKTDLFDVKGYGVIVTGGASGIGLAYSEALAEHGARVTMLDVNQERIATETARLRGFGWDVRGEVVDVTDKPSMHRVFDETTALYGRLDVVFANAGIDPGPGFAGWVSADVDARPQEYAIENYAEERWRHVLDINLDGVFTTIKAAARNMKSRRSGRIIVTTSIASTTNTGGIGAAYMAAKAGAAHLMRNAALELVGYGINVNAIAPGPFITNIAGGHSKIPAVQEEFSKHLPIKRMAQTEEIKGLALLLSSQASSFIVGVEIAIDGGSKLLGGG